MNSYSLQRVEGSRKRAIAARTNEWLAQRRPGLMSIKDVQAWVAAHGLTVLDSYASAEEGWRRWVLERGRFMFEVTEPEPHVGGQPLIRRIKEARNDKGK